eukprot:TRINITY_DN67450_c7_g8_i1.p1 TRINITY_DN67450_c7_g8~~TRINITY_DN67450_c7_g8_i1.p1  ORF type:complete len:339 (+),score=31.39 TRINITY_DN67450_c7_g8_i1:39-1055(+)
MAKVVSNLSEARKQTMGAFSTFLESLDNIRESVKQKQSEFDQHCTLLTDKIEKAKNQSMTTASSEHKTVKLDVGGQTFRTSSSTLLSVHESFFWCMLHSGSWTPDEETGSYFIDRSPVVFPLILEAMRQNNPNVSTKHLSEFEMSLLESDIDYYGLGDFFNKVSSKKALLAWSHCTTPKTNTGDSVQGIQFTGNATTAVIAAGIMFPHRTRIMSTPLKQMLNNNTGECVRWSITCKMQPPWSAAVYSQIMDSNCSPQADVRGVWIHLCECRSKLPSLIVQFKFNPNGNTIEMQCDQWRKTCNLKEKGITDPVCAIELVAYDQPGTCLDQAATFCINTE